MRCASSERPGAPGCSHTNHPKPKGWSEKLVGGGADWRAGVRLQWALPACTGQAPRGPSSLALPRPVPPKASLCPPVLSITDGLVMHELSARLVCVFYLCPRDLRALRRFFGGAAAGCGRRGVPRFPMRGAAGAHRACVGSEAAAEAPHPSGPLSAPPADTLRYSSLLGCLAARRPRASLGRVLPATCPVFCGSCGEPGLSDGTELLVNLALRTWQQLLFQLGGSHLWRRSLV